ncbi:hypothetical protein FOA52_005274 [Chlamydomonas sp. UWO 241]|nr:hypothetical protein FOA52_005274 [Chlamydomonas sp. UWO 241]
MSQMIMKSGMRAGSRMANGFVRAGASDGVAYARPIARSAAVSVHQYQELRLRTILARCTSTEAPKAPATEPAAAAAADPPISCLDIRVGRIIKCEPHPDAESLYVEQIDVGEAEPRTIVSGLVKFVPLELMQGRPALVLCNLKPRNMRGVKSNGMVLCASDASHESVEPLRPPEGAAIGERVWFGDGNQGQAAAEPANRVDKKKMWEALQPHLKTDRGKVAGFKGQPMMTSAGACVSDTLANGTIS